LRTRIRSTPKKRPNLENPGIPEVSCTPILIMVNIWLLLLVNIRLFKGIAEAPRADCGVQEASMSMYDYFERFFGRR